MALMRAEANALSADGRMAAVNWQHDAGQEQVWIYDPDMMPTARPVSLLDCLPQRAPENTWQSIHVRVLPDGEFETFLAERQPLTGMAVQSVGVRTLTHPDDPNDIRCDPSITTYASALGPLMVRDSARTGALLVQFGLGGLALLEADGALVVLREPGAAPWLTFEVGMSIDGQLIATNAHAGPALEVWRRNGNAIESIHREASDLTPFTSGLPFPHVRHHAISRNHLQVNWWFTRPLEVLRCDSTCVPLAIDSRYENEAELSGSEGVIDDGTLEIGVSEVSFGEYQFLNLARAGEADGADASLNMETALGLEYGLGQYYSADCLPDTGDCVLVFDSALVFGRFIAAPRPSAFVPTIDLLTGLSSGAILIVLGTVLIRRTRSSEMY